MFRNPVDTPWVKNTLIYFSIFDLFELSIRGLNIIFWKKTKFTIGFGRLKTLGIKP